MSCIDKNYEIQKLKKAFLGFAKLVAKHSGLNFIYSSDFYLDENVVKNIKPIRKQYT